MKAEQDRIFDLLNARSGSVDSGPSLHAFREGKWKRWGIEALSRGVAVVRDWLQSLNLSSGDRILTVPITGSPEWVMIDWACLMEGLVLVPIHQTIDEATLQVIVEKVAPVLCVADDIGQYHKVRSVVPALDVYHLEYYREYCLPILPRLLHPGGRSTAPEVVSGIAADTLAYIMFTSGTSGDPKGVALTHSNIVSNIRSIGRLLPLRPGHRVISFLPYSHIFERTACMTYIHLGVDVYFSSGKDHLLKDFQQVRPHFFTAVPRMLEKTYDYVIGMQLSANPLKRWWAKWAVETGKQYGTDRGKGVYYRMKLWVAWVSYFHFWHRRMGGAVRWIGVGAAALPPAIAQLFGAAGVQVREGYGMTETAPVISFNSFEPGGGKWGSVGRPIEGVEVKLLKAQAADAFGQIAVKGPNVMKGYYRDVEATDAAFTLDGWLKTGDVGRLDEEGFLYITDRAKDIFKTSSGKYIAPACMEQRICTSPYIHQCLYVGANRPYPVAVIVPNFDLLQRWAKRNKIHWTSPQYMVHNIKIRSLIQVQVEQVNREVPHFKRVRDFVLAHEEWSVESGEISASLKMIRKHLWAKYDKHINKLYPQYH